MSETIANAGTATNAGSVSAPVGTVTLENFGTIVREFGNDAAETVTVAKSDFDDLVAKVEAMETRFSPLLKLLEGGLSAEVKAEIVKLRSAMGI